MSAFFIRPIVPSLSLTSASTLALNSDFKSTLNSGSISRLANFSSDPYDVVSTHFYLLNEKHKSFLRHSLHYHKTNRHSTISLLLTLSPEAVQLYCLMTLSVIVRRGDLIFLGELSSEHYLVSYLLSLFEGELTLEQVYCFYLLLKNILQQHEDCSFRTEEQLNEAFVEINKFLQDPDNYVLQEQEQENEVHAFSCLDPYYRVVVSEENSETLRKMSEKDTLIYETIDTEFEPSKLLSFMRDLRYKFMVEKEQLEIDSICREMLD